MRDKRALHEDAMGDARAGQSYPMLKEKLWPPMHRVELKETACIGE